MIANPRVDVLRLAARGYTNGQIARRLDLAQETVAHHLGAWRRQLGSRNTTHAVALAIVRGVIRGADLKEGT